MHRHSGRGETSGSEAGSYFKAHRLCVSLNSRRGSNKEEDKGKTSMRTRPHARPLLPDSCSRALFGSEDDPVSSTAHRVQRLRERGEFDMVCRFLNHKKGGRRCPAAPMIPSAALPRARIATSSERGCFIDNLLV